jgi:hypothetical protein
VQLATGQLLVEQPTVSVATVCEHVLSIVQSSVVFVTTHGFGHGFVVVLEHGTLVVSVTVVVLLTVTGGRV